MKTERKCGVPGCPRKDMEHGRKLCPGHQILWDKSEYRFSTRLDAFEAWVTSLKKTHHHTNGVT